MSTNSAVIPLWADSTEPVRVSRTQRCAYCERLVHTFCPVTRHPSEPSADLACTARHARAARLLPVPGSENPWHQTSSPRSSRGTIAADSSGAPKVITDGPSTSGIEYRPVSTRSRAATASLR